MDTQLTPLELNVKWAMENCFIPALHEVLSKADPKKYDQWAGNACKQAAIFGAAILEGILPQYKWTVWEGIFDDIVNDKPSHYNHAWIYGVDRESGRRLLVDMAREYRERLFIVVTGNRYPKDHPEYMQMVEKSRSQHDYKTRVNEIEYYTQRNGVDVLMDVLRIGGQKELEAKANGTRPY